MGYIGRNLTNLSDRVVLDSITTSSTDTFTLQLNSVNFVPSSAESLTVSLNGVIQAPISSYTVSGSSIVFASSLSASDSIDFIIAERGITLQTPSAGSVGTSQLASSAVTTAKISDDAVTKDKVSNLMYPAFHSSLSANQTISDVTVTKVQFDTELFDTDNCYDNSTNYRFTPTVAGKYFIYTHIDGDTTGINKTDQVQLYIKKNGVTAAFIFDYPYTAAEANNIGLTLNTTLDMNGTTDYAEVFAYIDVVSGFNARVGGNSSYSRSAFGAYRIGD